VRASACAVEIRLKTRALRDPRGSEVARFIVGDEAVGSFSHFGIPNATEHL